VTRDTCCIAGTPTTRNRAAYLSFRTEIYALAQIPDLHPNIVTLQMLCCVGESHSLDCSVITHGITLADDIFVLFQQGPVVGPFPFIFEENEGMGTLGIVLVIR
jgi:hypothetical protein